MGIKCVQVTTGDKVTASKEPKYQKCLDSKEPACQLQRDKPQWTNCGQKTQAHTITAHVLAWHHSGVMAPQEHQEMGICLSFYYNLKNKPKSSFHLIRIKLKLQK